MKIFIPKNWNDLKDKLKRFGKVVEIRNGEVIECKSIDSDFELKTSINLIEVVRLLASLFDFSAFIDFKPEYLREILGFNVPLVDNVNDVLKAPEFESVDSIVKKVKRADVEECGAIGLFIGFVKEISDGKKVKWLEYEAYEEFLYEKIKEIEKKLMNYTNIANAKVFHRVGKVLPKDDIIYIAVVGKSRKDVWKPLIDGIETVKTTLPIWKKEVYYNGEKWVHDKSLNL